MVLTLVVFQLVFWVQTGFCLSTEEILNWVAYKMKIEYNDPTPTVLFVDENEIRTIFRNNNNRSFQRWEAEYGKDTAEKILDNYLKDVVGLFVPDSQIICVGNFLDPSRRQAVLAHELTHYLQHWRYGKIRENDFFAGEKYLMREMEAYNNEECFKKEFYPGDSVESED